MSSISGRRMPRFGGGVVLALAVLVAAAAGCDRSGSSSSPSGKKTLTIGVIPKGLTHSFWKSVKAGADRAAKEVGAEVKWDGPPRENEVNTQMRIVGDMMTVGVDALAVAPLSDTALTPSLADARKKVPVVVFDSGSTFADYNAFVATDNFKGGQLAGREMLRLIGDAKGVTLVMVRYDPASQSTVKREEGFLTEIRKNGAIKVIENQFAGETVDKAQAMLGSVLTDQPNVSAVFASNESTAEGSLIALRDKNLLGKVRFVGFDTNAVLLDGLEKGTVNALVLQDPVRMGYLAVKAAAAAAARNEAVEKEQPISPVLATPANMNEAAVRQLLRPTF